jgi:hypothetical protein
VVADPGQRDEVISICKRFLQVVSSFERQARLPYTAQTGQRQGTAVRLVQLLDD